MQLKDRKLLARLMAIQGISCRQLAREAGWNSHTYLQRLLRGDVNTLKTDPAILIAHRLQVPTDVLFVTKVSANPEQDGDENGRKKAS
jgi:transcriptional regulator with XRE-family HTH domain